MAMTLRLTAEQDEMLQALADDRGVSKQKYVLDSIEQSFKDLENDKEFAQSYEWASNRYSDVLRRLGE